MITYSAGAFVALRHIYMWWVFIIIFFFIILIFWRRLFVLWKTAYICDHGFRKFQIESKLWWDCVYCGHIYKITERSRRRLHGQLLKNCWGMWIIFQHWATINCPPPQWKKNQIKSKKLISAIVQIDLTWLVPVILLHVLECIGISRLHFVLLIYFNRFFFLLHNIKRYDVLLYDIF